jgi:hypothetical protein
VHSGMLTAAHGCGTQLGARAARGDNRCTSCLKSGTIGSSRIVSRSSEEAQHQTSWRHPCPAVGMGTARYRTALGASDRHSFAQFQQASVRTLGNVAPSSSGQRADTHVHLMATSQALPAACPPQPAGANYKSRPHIIQLSTTAVHQQVPRWKNLQAEQFSLSTEPPYRIPGGVWLGLNMTARPC